MRSVLLKAGTHLIADFDGDADMVMCEPLDSDSFSHFELNFD